MTTYRHINYRIITAADGTRGIECFHCRKISYNLGDIENKYCGNCHIFHEGVLPRATDKSHLEKVAMSQLKNGQNGEISRQNTRETLSEFLARHMNIWWEEFSKRIPEIIFWAVIVSIIYAAFG